MAKYVVDLSELTCTTDSDSQIVSISVYSDELFNKHVTILDTETGMKSEYILRDAVVLDDIVFGLYKFDTYIILIAYSCADLVLSRYISYVSSTPKNASDLGSDILCKYNDIYKVGANTFELLTRLILDGNKDITIDFDNCVIYVDAFFKIYKYSITKEFRRQLAKLRLCDI